MRGQAGVRVGGGLFDHLLLGYLPLLKLDGAAAEQAAAVERGRCTPRPAWIQLRPDHRCERWLRGDASRDHSTETSQLSLPQSRLNGKWKLKLSTDV